MNHPENLRYTATHEWVRTENDGTLTVGITHHAQDALGDMVFIELPELGRKLAAEEVCAVVESVKAASDIYAPAAGEVVAVNEVVVNAPGDLNKDPYAAWLFRIRPAAKFDPATLLDAAAYEKGLA
jgi:glycine cleavage system H protein